MRKIYCIILAIILGCFLFSGCGMKYSNEETQLQKEAVNAAQDLVEKRFTKEPYNICVGNYSMEQCRFKKMDGDAYIVSVEYSLSYGQSADNVFFDISVEERIPMVKSENGTWFELPETEVELKKSSIDSINEERITSFADSKYVPVLSRQDIAGMTISEIAKDLLNDFIFYTGGAVYEKTTFFLTGGTAIFNRIEPVEIPLDNCDVLGCWKVDGGVRGKYIGYMKELGYCTPLLTKNYEQQEEMDLIKNSFYLIEKEDGYYLETEALFKLR